ncbi:unnamed protein product [Phyllotreta striolata]|uniref:Borealin C-terminal domain-containing protein n=1 Tax=Phyllotreta striolata TaxID=444603 RepID=A0A9N9T9U6_PHYSR|nr:unnamed protein product [Phyllotreta striolata]
MINNIFELLTQQMPRTKVVKKGAKKESRREGQDENIAIAKILVDFEKKSSSMIKEEKERQISLVTKHYCDLINSISGTVLTMTIGECKRLGTSLHNGTLSNVTKSKLEVTKSTRKTRSRSYDDGYLTTESSNSSERSRSRTKKQSTAKANRFLTPASKGRHPYNCGPVSPKGTTEQIQNRFVTPASKGRNPNNYGPVTPKIVPNTPQIIMRRPIQGEVALSLQGSPLLVNPTTQDCATTINIPLEGGCQLSLLPQTGLRPSLLPVLDQNTKEDLRILNEHLTALLNNQK